MRLKCKEGIELCLSKNEPIKCEVILAFSVLTRWSLRQIFFSPKKNLKCLLINTGEKKQKKKAQETRS